MINSNFPILLPNSCKNEPEKKTLHVRQCPNDDDEELKDAHDNRNLAIDFSKSLVNTFDYDHDTEFLSLLKQQLKPTESDSSASTPAQLITCESKEQRLDERSSLDWQAKQSIEKETLKTQLINYPIKEQAFRITREDMNFQQQQVFSQIIQKTKNLLHTIQPQHQQDFYQRCIVLTTMKAIQDSEQAIRALLSHKDNYCKRDLRSKHHCFGNYLYSRSWASKFYKACNQKCLLNDASKGEYLALKQLRSEALEKMLQSMYKLRLSISKETLSKPNQIVGYKRKRATWLVEEAKKPQYNKRTLTPLVEQVDDESEEENLSLVDFFAKLEKWVNEEPIVTQLSEKDIAEQRQRMAEKLDEFYQHYFGQTLENLENSTQASTAITIDTYGNNIKEELKSVILTTRKTRELIQETLKMIQCSDLEKQTKQRLSVLHKQLGKDLQPQLAYQKHQCLEGLLTSILPNSEKFKVDFGPFFEKVEIQSLTKRDLTCTIKTADTWAEVKVKHVKKCLQKHQQTCEAITLIMLQLQQVIQNSLHILNAKEKPLGTLANLRSISLAYSNVRQAFDTQRNKFQYRLIQNGRRNPKIFHPKRLREQHSRQLRISIENRLKEYVKAISDLNERSLNMGMSKTIKSITLRDMPLQLLDYNIKELIALEKSQDVKNDKSLSQVLDRMVYVVTLPNLETIELFPLQKIPLLRTMRMKRRQQEEDIRSNYSEQQDNLPENEPTSLQMNRKINQMVDIDSIEKLVFGDTHSSLID